MYGWRKCSYSLGCFPSRSECCNNFTRSHVELLSDSQHRTSERTRTRRRASNQERRLTAQRNNSDCRRDRDVMTDHSHLMFFGSHCEQQMTKRDCCLMKRDCQSIAKPVQNIGTQIKCWLHNCASLSRLSGMLLHH